MDKEFLLTHANRVHVPEVARCASDLVAAMELATPESPTSLDALVKSGDIVTTLETRLTETNALYARHNALFLVMA